MKHRYIRLALEPRCTDGLRIRKTLQDALQDMFGLVFAGTYIDVLSVDEPGSEAVIRVHAGDASRIMAAMAGGTRVRVAKESSFLPSLAS